MREAKKCCVSSRVFSQQAKTAVLEGDKTAAVQVANNAIAQGVNLSEIIDNGLTPGMVQVANLFAKEEIPLPAVLLAAEAMNEALRILESHMAPGKSRTVIFGKKGIFFAQRVLAQMAPLTQALKLMESTRYTWPPLLWNIPGIIRNVFLNKK